MTKKDIVINLHEAIEFNRFGIAESYLADDFHSKGGHTGTMNKQEWIEFIKKLKQGFPNFTFNLHDINESGNKVNATYRFLGINSEDLPELIDGVGTIGATGLEIENPNENVVFVVKDDKVESIQVENLPDGGVTGVYKRLGVHVAEE